jgi:pyrimidine-nucleoside phosphorylase
MWARGAGFAPFVAKPGLPMGFDMRRAIARKRDGGVLSAGDWHSILQAHQTGEADDAQLAALLMAAFLRGLDTQETAGLTRAMIESGETLEAPAPNCVDKHSSGGVADTASLIVVPIVAACGIPVAKLSGRALGHTGGTLDKLEAIEGVRTDLAPERFAAQVREVGCAIAAQSARLVPADKKMYALRDRTSTVQSLGLVAASIVSKKIAAGAPAIVYDVKVGGGAFFNKLDDARALAQTLVDLSVSFGRRAVAIVTDMNEPLGASIGTGLEALAAREFLDGTRRDARLRALCQKLGIALLAAGGYAGDAGEAFERALAGGAAYERFERMLAAQGMRPGALEKLVPHGSSTQACAERTGFVAAIDASALGLLARDAIEAHGSNAGIVVHKRIGDAVRSGEALATVYGASDAARAAGAFAVGDAPPPERPLVYFETASVRSTLETR